MKKTLSQTPNELRKSAKGLPEELRRITSAGGRASGVSRRRKRDLREAAELYLSLPVADKRQLSKLSKAGVETEDADNQMAIVAGLAVKAMRGDAKAAKLLFDLLPEQAGSMQAAAQEDDPITQALKEEAERGTL